MKCGLIFVANGNAKGIICVLCIGYGKIRGREVTNIINIPNSTIHSIRTRGIEINKLHSGHPRTLSSHDIRQIIRYIRTNKSTHRIGLTQLKKVLHLQVHEHTIRNALRKAGYHHRVAQRRPYLNKRDRRRRLKFAKEHKDWTVEQWASVLFSDEMAVKLFLERHSKGLCLEDS